MSENLSIIFRSFSYRETMAVPHLYVYPVTSMAQVKNMPDYMSPEEVAADRG